MYNDTYIILPVKVDTDDVPDVVPQQSESDPTDEFPPSVLSKKRHDFENDSEEMSSSMQYVTWP